MEYAGESRIGLRRTVNQDSILILSSDNASIFAVADGMGGHSDGEKASQAIIGALEEWWQHSEIDEYKNDFFRMVDDIRGSMERINKAIYDKYNQGAVCGSTVSILLVAAGNYAVFHVGDSRIYKLEKRKFGQITMDEVWENDIRTWKKFTSKEIRISQKRGKLINAVGTTPELMMTIKTDCLSDKMLFLLCSDGLYKMVRPRYMLSILKKVNKGASIKWGVDELMNEVYLAGAKDNVSIVLVRTEKCV